MGKKYPEKAKPEPSTLYRSAGFATIHIGVVRLVGRAEPVVCAARGAPELTDELAHYLPAWIERFAGVPGSEGHIREIRSSLQRRDHDAALETYFEHLAPLHGDVDGHHDQLHLVIKSITLL